jgi:hypothetical protein
MSRSTTQYARSNFNNLASRIVRRRHDGSTFDKPCTGGQLNPDTRDLLPRDFVAKELRPGRDRHQFGEVRLGHDGLYHRVGEERERPKSRAPEQYRPETHGGDFKQPRQKQRRGEVESYRAGLDIGYNDMPSGTPSGSDQ